MKVIKQTGVMINMNVKTQGIIKTLPDGNILRLKEGRISNRWILQWHKANKYFTNWIGLGSHESFDVMKERFDTFHPKTFENHGNYPESDPVIKRIRETGW